MRVLLVMVFGFILAACGQDYESEYVKLIGTSIDNAEGLESYQEQLGEDGIIEYKKNIMQGKELDVTLITKDNIVYSVTFDGTGYRYSKDDFENLIGSLIKKHGEPIFNVNPSGIYWREVGFNVQNLPYSHIYLVHLDDKNKEGFYLLKIYSKDI